MRFEAVVFGVVLACVSLAPPSMANAQTVSGTADVIDGDSLTVGGRAIRLVGIDAPEFKQTCARDGASWACGEAAKDNLRALVAGETVTCRGQGVDQYARLLAVCSAGGVELNEAMVEYGWAVAYRQFSDAYVPAEVKAKSNRFGIWASTFIAPADYRQSLLPKRLAPSRGQNRSAANRSSNERSTGCLIKGNHSRKGEWIYHLPGMPYYEQTRAEAMFCNEAEAQAAGYRRSRAGR